MLLAVGVLLEFLKQQDIVTLFPTSWHPYIAGASAMLAIIAASDTAERVRDLRRANERLRQSQQMAPEDTEK